MTDIRNHELMSWISLYLWSDRIIKNYIKRGKLCMKMIIMSFKPVERRKL